LDLSSWAVVLAEGLSLRLGNLFLDVKTVILVIDYINGEGCYR